MICEERIAHNVPLAPLCTFELGGPARHLIEAPDEETVIDALRWARQRSLATVVLGGGSNVVIADRGFDGLAIRMVQRGVEVRRKEGVAWVTALAGEPWDPVVELAVSEGFAGIECLSGIPGLVGAAPIRNLGAYGQEVSETLASVRVLDSKTLEIREMPASECRFAYRDSIFKQAPTNRFIVLAVTFALRASSAAVVLHPELARALDFSHARPTLALVRETVIALRRHKSMVLDSTDENRRSAGSFFTHPIVSTKQAVRVVERALAADLVSNASDVPHFPMKGGRVKLVAGWLIERAGVRKGERHGRVGISSRHALALVHHGGGITSELLGLACRVRDAVFDCFGVRLIAEPAFVGFGTKDPLGIRTQERKLISG